MSLSGNNNLDTLLSPDEEISSEDVRQIIDFQQIQDLMNSFYKVTRIGMSITDLKGNILVATGWQDICTKFHRLHPQTLANCVESDIHLSQGLKGENYKIYKCKNNIWDIATPINVAGKHIANFFLGQFFFEDELPDRELFTRQAEAYGFDKEEYLAALERIPRWSRETVQNVMEFYSHFAQMVAELSYRNIRLAKELVERNRAEEELRESEQRYREIYDNTSDCIFLLDVTSDGRFKFAGFNPAEEKTVGLSSSEVSGRFVEDAVSAEIAKGPISHYRHCLETGIPIHYDEELDLPVGLRHFNTSLIPLRDTTGRINRIIGIGRDITHRKQVEEALQKSEEKFAKSFRSTPSVLSISTIAEGRYLEVNEAFELAMGYLREEVIGRSVLDLNIWEEPQARARFIQVLLEHGKVHDLEGRFRHKSGRLIEGLFSAEIIEIEGEQCLLTLVNDITARKLVEEALLVSEAEKSLILNSTSDLVIYHDSDMKVVWCNQKALDSVGLRQEEMVGRHCWEIWHHRIEACAGCSIILALKTGEPQEGEFRSSDGREWYVRGFLVKGEDGRVKGVVKFSLEITERKRVEKALFESERLLESEKRFRLLFENMLEGVAYCRMLYDDNGCPQDFVYLDVNSSYLKLTGLHDVVGKRISELLPGIKKSTPELFDLYGRVAATGRAEKCEIYVSQLSLWRSMSVYSTEKGYFVAVSENITERKRFETNLQESHFNLRKLTAHLNLTREMELKAFARKVHDELGTSLTLLKFDLAWLKRNYPTADKSVTERIRAMDELIHESTKTVQLITSELRPSLLDEQGLAATIEWQAREFEKRSGIAFNLEIDPSIPSLSQDKTINVFRIFQQALSNVMRHADATSVLVSLSKTARQLVLQIADNGTGISDQALSAATSFGIMGMKERTRLCDGNITIVGTQGIGTTISVSIPIDEKGDEQCSAY